MQFDEYQKKSRETAQYPSIVQSFVYPVMGLASEVGELLGKIKKIFRDDKGIVTDLKKQDISKELGDVLWYVAQVATEFDLKLEDVALANIEKLQSRLKRGTIGGSGDNR
jgi:NTP pyrophosphatase (non-canonical NTP hydrolase)